MNCFFALICELICELLFAFAIYVCFAFLSKMEYLFLLYYVLSIIFENLAYVKKYRVLCFFRLNKMLSIFADL